MKWNDKLRQYLKNEGISQKEAAVLLHTSPSMMSRFLSGNDNINQDFIINLLKAFPEIDLQSIFSEAKEYKQEEKIKKVNEPQTLDVQLELNLIQEKIELIKLQLAQDCHAKKK